MRTALAGLAVLGSALSAQSTPQMPSRIVLLVLDDVGADTLAQVNTPNIDALAAGGLRFSRAYSHPWCKPSRDSLLRGAAGGEVRSDVCLPVDDTALDSNIPTFVGALREAGYLTGLVGKWHVGRSATDGMPWWYAPHAAGFDHWWAGTGSSSLGGCNPNGDIHDDGAFYDYPDHETVVQRDALFALMDEADAQGKPLFAWVGFTDAHKPWTAPPPKILPAGYKLPRLPWERDYYEAEVTALDFVVGEIVARLPPDAWIILVSENGTPEPVTVPKTKRAKKTVYERGVHVPMIFNGPGLVPGVNSDPAQLYDLPATLLASLGIPGPSGQGRNLLAKPVGIPFAFVSNPKVGPNLSRAVIEPRYKLIDKSLTGFEFYDLLLDPGETTPLPQIGPDFDRLAKLLTKLPGI